MIQVLCASLGNREPQGLEHIPGGYEITYCADKPWAVAANKLLDMAAEKGQSALFLDDDIELTPHTFRLIDKRKPLGDVMGFTLLYKDGRINGAGHVFVPAHDTVMMRPQNTLYDIMTPRYVAHVTASCFLLSARLLQSGVRFPVWEGQHYEDIAFTIEAWRQGFTVAYVPGVVWHEFDNGSGAGQTKGQMENFQRERAINEKRLQAWYCEIGLTELCIQGIVPMGSQEIR